MKLIEALHILKGMKDRKGGTFSCFLATGLNPLHLRTFLAAELGLLFPDQTIEITDGSYGALLGNLGRLAKADVEIGIVLLEWPDLDPRLGIRSTARWTPSELADILSTAEARAGQIQRAIEKTCLRLPLVLCCPTLPLPPISFAPGWQASSLELELKAIVQNLSSKASQCVQVRVLSTQRLDFVSPLGERFDVESEVLTGFPYRLPHASALANLLAHLTPKASPKKGIITDLDDTLWRGILGEAGIDGISWDLDRHSQMHAFYQRLLGALASEGVLIGVASKNDRSLVEEAFQRQDLALSPDAIFPIEASWGSKSQSVARILKTWNVGPDSVVFVDDSSFELAEVKAAHPEIECLQFPTKDSAAVYDLALRLRDLFGKNVILEEDSIRIESMRRPNSIKDFSEAGAGIPTSILEQVGAEVSFNFNKTPLDLRALELVNKTNQFNLNGKRYTEAAWQKYLMNPATFCLVASYRDKFGPLGKIAVLAGGVDRKRLVINSWAISCRAFSRQIEYKCLAELLARFEFGTIEFEYLRTDRNGPLRDFLSEILGATPAFGCTVSREVVETRLGTLIEAQEVMNG